MKAFTESHGSIHLGISLVLGKGITSKRLLLDEKNPPKIENGGTIYDCGILEPPTDSKTHHAFSETHHAFIAGRPNDNRALLHILTKTQLSPYFHEGFPQMVERISLVPFHGKATNDPRKLEPIRVYNGTSYLLIFSPGDTIATTETQTGNESWIYQWDGDQFRSWNPQDYLNQVVQPWMDSASKKEIDEAIQKANYPLLRQFLQGPPEWKEL